MDVIATISRPHDEYETDWNWAEAATAAWLDAAAEAGITAVLTLTEVPDETCDVAYVLADGQPFLLSLREDTVTATPAPPAATYTLEGALSVRDEVGGIHQLGYFDADGGGWVEGVDSLLRRAGYERTGDWAGDDAPVREITAPA